MAEQIRLLDRGDLGDRGRIAVGSDQREPDGREGQSSGHGGAGGDEESRVVHGAVCEREKSVRGIETRSGSWVCAETKAKQVNLARGGYDDQVRIVHGGIGFLFKRMPRRDEHQAASHWGGEPAVQCMLFAQARERAP
jgi:hypothetical protein